VREHLLLQFLVLSLLGDHRAGLLLHGLVARQEAERAARACHSSSVSVIYAA
jgi:hypothetical protein